MKHLTAALVALLLLVSSLPASAQVVNPTVVQFTASTDHATVVNGTPLVTSYQLDIMTSTATSALAFTVSLGKPTPDATTSVIVTPVIPQFAALGNGMYVATVSAIGPGGSGKSTPTAPFARIGPAHAPTAVTVITR